MANPAKHQGRKYFDPIECYRRNPQENSPVVPFPASVNKPALARMALSVVHGGHEDQFDQLVKKRASELYRKRVPKHRALIEAQEFSYALAEMIEAVKQVEREECQKDG